MLFLSVHSKDDQDQGVSGPSLETANEDPGQNRKKKLNPRFQKPNLD